MSTVKNIDTIPHDLDDGRVLPSEGKAKNVELTDRIRGLVDDGHLIVLDKQGRDRSATVNPPADAGDDQEG